MIDKDTLLPFPLIAPERERVAFGSLSSPSEPADPLRAQTLWISGAGLAAVGIEARLKAADQSLIPAAAGAALSKRETERCAPAFGASAEHWSVDPLAPLEAFREAFKIALDRALGQACQVSAQALVSDQGDTVMIVCAAVVPEPLDMSQWGVAQSRMRSLLRLAGVDDPMARAQNAIHCSLADRLDDWVEELAVEASPPPGSAL